MPELTPQHALRGADAVHLASALAVGGDGDVLFAVWDRRLRSDAMRADLRVAPAP